MALQIKRRCLYIQTVLWHTCSESSLLEKSHQEGHEYSVMSNATTTKQVDIKKISCELALWHRLQEIYLQKYIFAPKFTEYGSSKYMLKTHAIFKYCILNIPLFNLKMVRIKKVWRKAYSMFEKSRQPSKVLWIKIWVTYLTLHAFDIFQEMILMFIHHK